MVGSADLRPVKSGIPPWKPLLGLVWPFQASSLSRGWLVDATLRDSISKAPELGGGQ